MKSSRRNIVVYCSLVAALTLTSVVLQALSPSPLKPNNVVSLFATSDATESFDAVFQTRAPIHEGRWQSIYIHHSGVPGGNVQSMTPEGGTLGDHFVIGNGDDCGDGEIQIGSRWMDQASATPPVGARHIDPGLISVCLVGDLNRSSPTKAQVRRLEQLVRTLQDRLQIPADRIVLINDPQVLAAGSGRFFPVASFRTQLLR